MTSLTGSINTETVVNGTIGMGHVKTLAIAVPITGTRHPRLAVLVVEERTLSSIIRLQRRRTRMTICARICLVGVMPMGMIVDGMKRRILRVRNMGGVCL